MSPSFPEKKLNYFLINGEKKTFSPYQTRLLTKLTNLRYTYADGSPVLDKISWATREDMELAVWGKPPENKNALEQLLLAIRAKVSGLVKSRRLPGERNSPEGWRLSDEYAVLAVYHPPSTTSKKDVKPTLIDQITFVSGGQRFHFQGRAAALLRIFVNARHTFLEMTNLLVLLDLNNDEKSVNSIYSAIANIRKTAGDDVFQKGGRGGRGGGWKLSKLKKAYVESDNLEWSSKRVG